MTHNNFLRQGINLYTGDDDNIRDNEDSKHENIPRPEDEIISVYEVYVKDEETAVNNAENQTNHSSSSVVNGIINGFKTDEKQPIKILKRNNDDDNDNDNKKEEFLLSDTKNGVKNKTVIRLIDKDDPRSRLHFVKYLKRDGKTWKIWECGVCSKEFRHQYTLMRHLPTHTDERNFKCETCGKAFRQLSTLSQHRAIHSDARPYVCECCKKTFNRVSTLISHRKTHSDDKPHKCEMCGKGFHQKGNLRNHVFTHTNERPYKCGLCGKGFNQMSNLMCHKIKSHANVDKLLPYGCIVCGKKFLRRFALRSHEESKHGIKYSQNKCNANTIIKEDISISNTNCEIDLITIDAIQTKAMQDALSNGQATFALFKPTKGIPILVKVSPASSDINDAKQILKAASAEDLKLAEKMCLSPIKLNNDIDGVEAVEIKVPIVATITQSLDSLGNFHYLVEAPGEEEPDQDIQGNHTSVDLMFDNENHSSVNVDTTSDQVIDPPDFLVPFSSSSSASSTSHCDIKYIRATEDGRYETITNNEAINFMAQDCHDVTILDDVDVASISFDDHTTTIINNNDNDYMRQFDRNKNNIQVFGDKDFHILGGNRDDDDNDDDDDDDDDDEGFVVNDDISLLEESKIEDFILGSSRNIHHHRYHRHHTNDCNTNNDDNLTAMIDSSFRNHMDVTIPYFHRSQNTGDV